MRYRVHRFLRLLHQQAVKNILGESLQDMLQQLHMLLGVVYAEKMQHIPATF